MGVSWWVSGLLGASDGWLVAPTNTNTSHRPPTFQCESMRISAIPLLKVGVWVMKYKNQYPRRNNKYVCAKKSPTIPNEKKQQRCTSTTKIDQARTKFPVFTTTCCIPIYYCCTDSCSMFFPVENGMPS